MVPKNRHQLEISACEIVVELYYDLCAKCGHAPERRDVETLSRRFHHEGISFFTETLPTIGRDLERALERGYIDAIDFPYFRKFKSMKCPCLFRVFFRHVFDETGQLLTEPDILSIQSIRQLSYLYKKIKEVCCESRIIKAFEGYKAIEQELQTHTFPEVWRDQFIRVSHYLWNSLNSFNAFEAIPKHGPGAVLERARGILKYPTTRMTWTKRLDEFFPFDAYCVPNANYTSQADDTTYYATDHESNLVFVQAVPKTALKPRLIGVEATANMYAQQGIKHFLYDALENRNTPYKGHINFANQDINGQLALRSSDDKKLATLDMSSASDRVPLTHVEMMLSSAPNLLNPMLACRAEYAIIPSDVRSISKGYRNCPSEKIKLTKFASMGSACCFPVESMYFYTICIMAILGDDIPTEPLVKEACSKVWVYGDDIIVAVEHVESIVSALVAFGNKVNTDKSFWKGNFRESCGVDAYKGVEITPVYMRKHIPRESTDPGWLSIVETANHLYEHGLWRSANLLVQSAESVLGKLPVTEKESAGLHLWSYQGVPEDFGLPKNRVLYCEWHQSQHYKLWQLSIPSKTTVPDGVDLLTSFFVDKENANIRDQRSQQIIEKSRLRDEIDQPAAGSLKLRWFPGCPYSLGRELT